jgi:hypothetical protein
VVQQRPGWWPRFSSALRSTGVTARIGRCYEANLILLLIMISAVSLILYAVKVIRDWACALRQGTSVSR